MRVYEIAKKNKLSSRQVLDILKEAGVDASSHMAVLSDDDLGVLKKALGLELLKPA